MRLWHKVVIPLLILAVASGCYLAFSKPETKSATNNQAQNTTAIEDAPTTQENSSAETPDVVISKEDLHKSDVPLPDKEMVERFRLNCSRMLRRKT